MYIGIAALVLAVSAYIYREGVPHSIFARLATFWSPNGPLKAITDGSESKSSVELNGASKNGSQASGTSYRAGLPSRKGKEEVLVDDDEEEEEDPTTPTAPVQIQLSIPEINDEADGGPRKRKGKSRRSDLDPDSDDDLRVPMFPALNSAQRASRPSIPSPTPSLVVPGSMAPPPLPVPKLSPGPPSLFPPGLMPPPPLPMRSSAAASSAANARSAQYSRPVSAGSSSLGVPPSGPSSLGVPQQRSSSSSLQLPPTHSQPPVKPRQKVILTPGHSPLDWANHQKRLPFIPLRRIAPSELATHGARKNETKIYWTVLEGKVYDMTPYLPYHPGGEKELLRVAGKDGTKLFNLTHPWVNWDNMLRGCEVGILVSENEMPQKESAATAGEVDLEGMD
ncbi:hypothetical protein H072_3940 [Dactylellina haptotyla CBS 200.50]|uniref:Cytochrome b5 heme-binding domain-containing protein n=1 Tax=Dactylellina haptotyla (strain CBS 200.50) TaxID=1284197 RepID=S8BRH5_DACHA|nr:hypothetical protein H072_3940 [Dactylellina haptotyla CBS 200.50]